MAVKESYFMFLSVICALFIGVFISINPLVGLLPVGLLMVFLILKYSTMRMYYLTFGSFFIFGGEDFTIFKLLFLVGLSVVAIGSLLNVSKNIKQANLQYTNSLVISCILFGGYVFISIFMAVVFRHTPIVSSLRDASPYILFALAPLFAVDIAIGVSKKNLKFAFYTIFLLGTVFFAYGWIVRRGYTTLPELGFGYVSFLLPLAFFAYCSAKSLRGSKKKLFWLTLSGVVLASMLLTGTRTSAIALLAPVVIAFMGLKGIVLRTAKLIFFALGITLFGYLSFLALGNTINVDFDSLAGKLANVSVLTDQGNLTNDGSFQDRYVQTQLTLQSWYDSPVMGVGPGTGFQYKGGSFNVDSPFSFLAKFGIVGFLFLFSTFICLIKFLKSIKYTIANYAVAGFLIITSALMLLASPFEDKGFSLALLLILAYGLKENKYELNKNDNLIKQSAA